MAVDVKLMNKGMRAPLAGLTDEGRAHQKLARQYREALVRKGWTDELTTELDEVLELVSSERAVAMDARAASRDNWHREQAAITGGKAFKRQLVHAAADLHADGVLPDDDYRTLTHSGRLERSSTALSNYFDGVRSRVQAIDPQLSPYFDGQSALARLDAVKAELDDAQSTQETAHAQLPDETQRLYEAKGWLLTLIEKMNRIAKIAFDGDAQTLAHFNKDLLLRARKARPAAAPAPAGTPQSAEG